MILNDNWTDECGQTRFAGERIPAHTFNWDGTWRLTKPMGWLSEYQINLRIAKEESIEALRVATQTIPSQIGGI